jgi:hypothetical protein
MKMTKVYRTNSWLQSPQLPSHCEGRSDIVTQDAMPTTGQECQVSSILQSTIELPPVLIHGSRYDPASKLSPTASTTVPSRWPLSSKRLSTPTLRGTPGHLSQGDRPVAGEQRGPPDQAWKEGAGRAMNLQQQSPWLPERGRDHQSRRGPQVGS